MIRSVLLTLGALASAGAVLPAEPPEPAPAMAQAANAFLAALDSGNARRRACPSTPRSVSTGTSCRGSVRACPSSRCPPKSGGRHSRS